MIKLYKFTMGVNLNGCKVSENIEIYFDDDTPEDEILKIVEEQYTEWVFERNMGTFYEVEE